jgi:hypothetical protein
VVNSNLGPDYNIAVRLSKIESRMDNLMTTPWLVNASTGSGIGQPGIKIDADGVHVFNSSDQQITGMRTDDGSVTAYDTTGAPVARFGPLTNSNPGNYGVEVLVGGGWVQVGGGTVDWTNVANKPATFAPSAHASSHGSAGSDPVSIAGTQVSSAVSDSSGSSHAFNYNVGGTSYYAVWVGSDYLMGKNTSSARYKHNIREHRIDPARVLALDPVLYERTHNGDVTEYGLIAEQVAELVPELAQWFHGKVDNVRYDLLAVALLAVVKDQERRLLALEGGTPPPAPTYHPPAVQANNAPAEPPAPHPYTIRSTP